ncbi:MAG: DUF177 domain-containing protein [Microbacteriaceae bacterium]|nr:DUF177 domain-containing protein [Microbacteriaceae bacterium]
MKTPSSNPFLINVFDVSHRTGEDREKHLVFPAPSRLGEGMAFIAEGTPIVLDVRLEGLHDGILVSAEVSTVASGECVRCLDEVSLPIEVEFQELFAYSPTEELEFSVHDNHVDCEPLIRDAVVLELPFQPLCNEDCWGLDPETGEKLSEPRSATSSDIDPRWAALEALASDTTTTADKPAAKKRT